MRGLGHRGGRCPFQGHMLFSVSEFSGRSRTRMACLLGSEGLESVGRGRGPCRSCHSLDSRLRSVSVPAVLFGSNLVPKQHLQPFPWKVVVTVP